MTLPYLNEIVCMDALELLAALPDDSIDMVLTDPPYGIGDVVSARRLPHERFEDVANNDALFTSWVSDAYRVLKVGGAAYIFASWRNFGDWQRIITDAGFIVRGCIVWDKVIHGLSGLTTHYAPRHEFIIYAIKGHHYLNSPRPKDVIVIPRVNAMELTHPYEKPILLLAELMRASSNEGDVILDIFAGSGATCDAALQMKRQFIGCDLSPEYVDLARKRLQNTDPFQASILKDGVKQLSLFSNDDNS